MPGILNTLCEHCKLSLARQDISIRPPISLVQPGSSSMQMIVIRNPSIYITQPGSSMMPMNAMMKPSIYLVQPDNSSMQINVILAFCRASRGHRSSRYTRRMGHKPASPAPTLASISWTYLSMTPKSSSRTGCCWPFMRELRALGLDKPGIR